MALRRPLNANFEAVVRESFALQTLMNTFGAQLRRVAPGEVEIEMPHSDRLTQQNGYLHAGVIASIADTANGYAALTLAPADSDVLAVEFKINLLAPARSGRYVARGRVLRPGKTLTVALAEVFGINADREELVATMLSTIINRARRH